MDKIGIFPWISSRCFKEDGTFFFIHLYYITNRPAPFCNLGFHLPGFPVDQVKVIPPVAFRCPNDFAPFFQIMTEIFSAVVDIGFTLLIYNNPFLSGCAINFHNLKDLVTTLVKIECESGTPPVPFQIGNIELILEWLRVDRDLFQVNDIKQ